MIIRFTYLILLAITLSNFTFAQNFWEKISSPTTNFLRTLYFADSLKGWVAGDSGAIFYTSDGGLNWTRQKTNTTSTIMRLFFLDSEKAWALAWADVANSDNLFYGTEILKTTNGGLDWSVEQYKEENAFLRGIYFIDTLKGFMGGVPAKFLATSDGGLNWEPANIDSGTFSYFPVINFKFYNDHYGFACGGRFDIAGVIWKTTNGGDSWTPIDGKYSPPDEVWDMHFFDSLHIIGIGGDPDVFGVGLIYSLDAGESWDYFEIGIPGRAFAMSFRTENEGWAVVPQSELFVTTFDYGYTWTPFTTPDSTQLYDIFFTDSITGYAVGDGGVIVKYKYQIPDYVDDENNLLTTNYELNQNYPNPFNPSTVIGYQIPVSSNITLKVYDILGNDVATLIDEYKPAGKYEFEFNTSQISSLSSGVYFYQLSAVSSETSLSASRQGAEYKFIQTKKMIYSK